MTRKTVDTVAQIFHPHLQRFYSILSLLEQQDPEGVRQAEHVVQDNRLPPAGHGHDLPHHPRHPPPQAAGLQAGQLVGEHRG